MRFDKPDGGKEVLPFTYCRHADDRAEWRWKAPPSERTLYNLHRLAERPDAPVLVVEGEKVADAAREIFPDRVAVTSQGGAAAARKTDWSPLAGRSVVIWPDNDDAGRRYAADVAELADAAGAASIAIVDVPPTFPEGWDLADPLPEEASSEDPVQLLHAAQIRQPNAATVATAPNSSVDENMPFRLANDGLFYCDPHEPDRGPRFVCGPFKLLAETRDAENRSWALLVELTDRDGVRHLEIINRSELAGDGAYLVGRLMDLGLTVPTDRKSRERFLDFLNRAKSAARARCVTSTGWHGDVFVLPDRTIGAGPEQVLLRSVGPVAHAYRSKGTLEEWRERVAAPAVGNSRPLLSICAGLAAPLLHLTGEESGGLHFRGGSSIGKSTSLFLAGSVWGGGSPSYVRQWRATDNGLEGVAAAHSDTLVCFDEMGQIDAVSAARAAYILANGSGKTRANRSGEARAPQQWRMLFLSTGEISLADKLAEVGRAGRAAAGQQVRVVDVPANAGAGLGVFENLHGHASGDAFARHLKAMSEEHYGHAGPAFVEALQAKREELVASVKARIHNFVEQHCPPDADGQVKRVAARFALLAAAGETARSEEIVSWPEGEAEAAAVRCFQDWLRARGTVEPTEVAEGIRQVLSMLDKHGSSRFENWTDLPGQAGSLTEGRTPNRLGWRRKNARDQWEYYVTASGMKDLTKGFDHRRILAALVEKGHLQPDGQGRSAKSLQVPSYPRQRLYHFVAPSNEEHDEDQVPASDDDLV